MNALRFDSKRCERIRGQFDAYVSNELLVETTSEVIKHLETCEACSRELDSLVRVRDAWRRAVRNQLPPADFSVAIHKRLREVRSGYFGGFSATRWALALVVSVAVIFAGGVAQQWLKIRHGRQLVSSILQLGVSDHLHCAIRGHNYPEIANPPDQLRTKLGPEYAGLLQVVEVRLPGFQVLEAHICSVPGSPRKYVHFITREHETILSVIITKREGEGLPVGRVLVAEASDGVNPYRAHIDEMDVVGFESKDYFGFVVSDLGQSKTVRLAAALAPGLRKALDGGAATGNSPAPAVLIRLSTSGLAWKTSLDGATSWIAKATILRIWRRLLMPVFVAVKVDYDTQPELAAELERAQAVLNLPSGLPLIGFMSPGGKLYFGWTYFPRETKGDRPAFENALKQALRMYHEHRSEVERDGVDLKKEE